MALENIFAEAKAAEARALRAREAAAARAAHRIEDAIRLAHDALADREPKGPVALLSLSEVLTEFAINLPSAPEEHQRRASRVAAHVLARASIAFDASYRGERSGAALYAPMPKDRLPPIPAADDDDL